MRLSRIVLVFLLICLIGQILYHYPNLPEQMASHFNALGEPDRWMSKQSFLIIEAVILLFLVTTFTLLPLLIEKMPNSLLNLPNKTYWLADERRVETFSLVRRFFEWFSVGLLGLFIAINEFVFRANLANQPLSNWIWIVLLLFFLFVGIWITKLILKFRLPK